ncbi:MAG TPA: rhomboid family intramembrane serine protease [Stellaceae bacterium]|nr:rhomboid family intramembrane serine protease [Stellaceae bacterium]
MIFALPLYDDNPIREAPVVTFALIGMCIGAFLWQLGQDEETVAFQYGMVPAVLFGYAHLSPRLAAIPAWATIFTSMFLHGGWLHLGGNLLFLWIFGNNVEDLLGRVRYLLLYLSSGVAAALVQALSAPESHVPMLGASGAVAGVLGAYLMTYPRANVHCFVWIVIFFWIMTVPAWILLGLWFAMQLLSGLASDPDSPGVAFWAHVGGFATGIVLFLLLRPRRVSLLQPQRTPIWATVPPGALLGRRTFHRGSVPDAGPRTSRPPGPWR